MTQKTGTPSAGLKEQALLKALRSNLKLLGELAVRYEVEFRPDRPADLPVIHCPQDVHNLLGPEMSALAQEQLRVLLLDTKNNLLAQRVIYQGNANSSIVRPAEVLRPAVVEPAPNIIIVHNHPTRRPHAQPGGHRGHQGPGPSRQAAGHRVAGPRRHRRRPVREPEGTGPHAQVTPASPGRRRPNGSAGEHPPDRPSGPNGAGPQRKW